MKIALLSGKGGTGKTLLSVNLAATSADSYYIDCDVEEPNGHLFFKPESIETETVSVRIPEINQSLCNGCRKCVDFCRFNALAYIKNKIILFDEICHSCGGCSIVCPTKAIIEKDRAIGKIQSGISEEVHVITGILNTGEESGVNIIKSMLNKRICDRKPVFIDCPPGSSCSLMESIKDADYCILIAEPTAFGAHNLNMIYKLVNLYKKPFSVIINKSIEGANPSEAFCKKNNIKIIEKIPFDIGLGKINSDGLVAVRENSKSRDYFNDLLGKIMQEVL
ncbi:MAG TPA: ATPase [Clostridiales bacterium]|nr:ATPase [Clostridiales bacterium]